MCAVLVQVTITQRAALLRYHTAELRLLDGEGAWQLRAIEHGGGGDGGDGVGADTGGGDGPGEQSSGGNGAIEELVEE